MIFKKYLNKIMKKFIFTLVFCLMLSIVFTSCNNNDVVTKKKGYPKAV